MLVKASFVAFQAGLCSLDDGGMQLQIRKPLLAGTITRLILKGLTQGLIIDGTLGLMWLGVNSVSMCTPPDITGRAIIGVTVGITSGEGVVAGIAFTVPAATLILRLIVLLQTYLPVHIRHAEAVVVIGDFDKTNRRHLCGGVLLFFAHIIPYYITVYIGNMALSDFIAWFPESITTGLNAAGGTVSAVDTSMLLTMMLKKDMQIYLMGGFVSAVYLGLSVPGIFLIGIVSAGIRDYNYVQRERLGISNTMELERGINL